MPDPADVPQGNLPSPTLPQWTPSQRELDVLDAILNGSLGEDVRGFVGPGGDAAVDPVMLVVAAAAAESAVEAGAIELIDPEGAPVARLDVEGVSDAGDDRRALIGPVSRLAHTEFGAFRQLHRGPAAVHDQYAADTLLGVGVRGPLSNADLAAIAESARTAGRRPLLVALVGDGMPHGSSGPGLIRMTLAAANELSDLDPVVVAVSLPDYGAEGAGLVDRVLAAYADKTAGSYGEAVDDFPAAVAAVVDHERPPRDRQGVVIFFTGLSGSGKSTLARALVDHILEGGERTITSLDGDVVRHHLSKGLGFSREDRETNILRIGYVAAEIARHGGVAICSPIAPFESTRAAVQAMVEAAGGGFLLVHVATPLEECERRDRKGLYARARRGEIPDFTGISSPYEEPRHYFAKIDTTNRDIAECLRELVSALEAEGWLHA
ncbi:MAG TPA: adenylyl-sulfate kinase [Nocardioidaceae bacterium]|nr:adenylyl-sulfate kinase [Nocardioidaceae bacterium]